MQKIKELFEKKIDRTIEEVIKVDQADQETVKNELEEYITTESIKSHYRDVLDAYHSAKNNPTEGIGIWISGFFGSGKSSFAKNLGYVLANREVLGLNASDIFSKQVADSKIKDLLKLINTNIPTHAVIFDVSMDRGVRTANERITEVMYKALLRELDYAEDFDLADLEMGLEADGLLADFEKKFEKKYKQPWTKRRKIGRALNEASATMHEMQPDTYNQPDSWVKSLGVKDDDGNIKGRADISANKLAEISFELMARRQKGKALVFVIDEVGQYVSRSVDRMLDLQAVVQAFGKEGKNRVKAKKAAAPSWIVVTSQEKLNEIVDALDSKKIELARLQDRFPVRVDLAPADIAEITSKRVLQKNPEAEKILAGLFDNNESRLNSYTKLDRTSRKISLSKKEFINLYPYLPYQIDLCIDIMSGIRLQPGAQRHIGGSNRTIIKQAQQMLISDKVNLGNEKIGALVTLDKVYELVDGNLSTEKRKDISDIIRSFAANPFYAKVAKALCLLEFVRDLPRTMENIAAVLFEKVDGSSRVEEVKEALKNLENAQFIRQSEEGYKLQTAQEKNWDTTRREIDAKPAQRNQIKKDILEEILSDHRIKTYRYKNLRNFKVGFTVDGDKIGEEGNIVIALSVADDNDDFKKQAKDAREQSRSDTGKNLLFWVIPLTEEIHQSIEEFHRSQSMISSHERIAAQGKLTVEESTCLNEEKTRKERINRDLRVKITEAVKNGMAYFQGVEKDVSTFGSELPEMTKGLLDFAVPDLYRKLEMGARNLTGKEAEQILTAVNLSGLPAVFYSPPTGLSLVIKEGAKFVPNTSADIAVEIFNYLKNMHSYGEKVTGKSLEDYFGGIGYGWERDVLRLVLAVLLRAGAIEVTSQGQKYSDHNNPNCRQAFIKDNTFKSASFSPYVSDVTLKVLTDAAKNYEAVTGKEVNVDKTTIANSFKQIASEDWETLLPVKATLDALNLPCSDFAAEHKEWLGVIQKANIDDCVKMLANEGKTYLEARNKIQKIAVAVSEPNISIIKKGIAAINQKYSSIKNIPEITEDVVQGADKLFADLASEQFFDSLNDIAKGEELLSEFYDTQYCTLHEKRFNAMNETIESIKGHSEWGRIPDENKKSLLAPLSARLCETCIIEPDGICCTNCHAPLSKLESDISVTETLLKNALQKIEELLAPEIKIERIKIAHYFSGSIESEEELDSGLEKIRDIAIKHISEGKKVILD